MLTRLLKLWLKRERGFTLLEVTASVVILSVIGMAVLSAAGKGQVFLSRQSNEMDSRVSARAVLTRMVKDIQSAKYSNVIDPQTILLTEQDNTTLTYGFDSTKKQVYLKDNNGQTIYLIHAISTAFFSPPGKNDQVNISMTVSVGSSQMTLSDTAVCRSVNFNTTGVPRITMVAPNNVQFNGVVKVNTENNDENDDDDNDVDGYHAQQTIHISAVDTHFDTKVDSSTYVVLVPQGSKLGNSDNVIYANNGSSAKIIRTDGSGTNIWFELKSSNVTNTTYGVWAITPNIFGNQPEKAFMLGALSVNTGSFQGGKNQTGTTSGPDDTSWDDGKSDNTPDWVADRGDVQGFGRVDCFNKVITKNVNANDKILYYNHPVTTFDYQVTVNISSGGSKTDQLALLTLFYNGLNNTNGGGGWYYGFGVNQYGVFYGAKGSFTQIPSSESNYSGGQAVLRAKADFDTDRQQPRLRLWVTNVKDSDKPVATIYKVPTDNSGLLGPGYLGVTVTSSKTNATFTVTRY